MALEAEPASLKAMFCAWLASALAVTLILLLTLTSDRLKAKTNITFNCKTVCDKGFERDVTAKLEEKGFTLERNKRVVIAYKTNRPTSRYSIYVVRRKDYYSHDSHPIFRMKAEGCYLVDIYRTKYETLYVLSFYLEEGGKLDTQNESNMECLSYVLGTPA